MFMVMTIESNIVGEYIRGQKGTNYYASKLKICIDIKNVVHMWGEHRAA